MDGKCAVCLRQFSQAFDLRRRSLKAIGHRHHLHTCLLLHPKRIQAEAHHHDGHPACVPPRPPNGEHGKRPHCRPREPPNSTELREQFGPIQPRLATCSKRLAHADSIEHEGSSDSNPRSAGIDGRPTAEAYCPTCSHAQCHPESRAEVGPTFPYREPPSQLFAQCTEGAVRWQEGSIPLADVAPKSKWPIRAKRMGIAHCQKQHVPCEWRHSSDGKLGEFTPRSLRVGQPMEPAHQSSKCCGNGAEVGMREQPNQQVDDLFSGVLPRWRGLPLELQPPRERQRNGVGHGVVPGPTQHLRMAQGDETARQNDAGAAGVIVIQDANQKRGSQAPRGDDGGVYQSCRPFGGKDMGHEPATR